MSGRPHGADRCHTQQCREGELRPTGTDDGQRRVAPGCLEGSGVAGWGAPGAAMPGSGVPSLALTVLGGGSDGVDAFCFAFLVRRAVEDKKQEEEEERKEEGEEAASSDH